MWSVLATVLQKVEGEEGVEGGHPGLSGDEEALWSETESGLVVLGRRNRLI